tara:strand:- start:628 stop:966 length:339 start_codon:yes stop_codon:yes gene_type:complete
MMDYYGSVIKSEQEIDNELIQRYKDRCHYSIGIVCPVGDKIMKIIISDLRKQEILMKEYSVSGWMVFHAKTIYETIEERINHYKTKQRLKFTYCFYQLFNDIDVCKMICDYI